MSTERRSDGFLRVVLVVIAAIVLLPMLMMVFAVPMMAMMGWWWSGGIAGGFSPLLGAGMMLLWLVALVGIGYLFYRGLVGGIGPSLIGDSALEELRLAYARGDLTDEEFEARRANLRREEYQ
ncbi:SHOCT domain-containing protein [Haloferax sp. DFSO52]|uniref:SHOCT domain-containing protein n=1 Tax=Haloferax sp. DFSO52 TaxID=3388505 RepID=UPI003A84D906